MSETAFVPDDFDIMTAVLIEDQTVPVTVEFLDEVCNPARGAQDFTFWGDGTTTMDPDFRAIVVRELGSVAAFRERYGFTKPTGAVE